MLKPLFEYIKENKDYELFVIAMISYFTNHFMNDHFMENYSKKASYTRNGNDVILYLPNNEDPIDIKKMYDDIINDEDGNLLEVPFSDIFSITEVRTSIDTCDISGRPTVPV